LVSGDTGTNIIADRDRIGRVLTNLLTNAVQYSPKADRILVKVTKNRDNLTVGVQDFGIGISKDNQERVFGRFYQVGRESSTERHDNLGVGLYIAKSIVERHGGQIWVKSRRTPSSRRGSTFCFSLPLKSSKKM
jgi:signal transduction histidine kinase